MAVGATVGSTLSSKRVMALTRACGLAKSVGPGRLHILVDQPVQHRAAFDVGGSGRGQPLKARSVPPRAEHHFRSSWWETWSTTSAAPRHAGVPSAWPVVPSSLAASRYAFRSLHRGHESAPLA